MAQEDERLTSPRISIIVPVYNTERYLRRCLDSIAAQTFVDWECILIDDGSPDRSGGICDDYAAKDSRFRVIHQQNAGVSAARNAGLDAAKGEWIGFVDSDDWIEPETYEIALDAAEREGADLVQWGICMNNDKKVTRSFVLKSSYFSVSKADIYWAPSMCHKIISGRIIYDNNIRFPDGIAISEDRLFAVQCYINARNCFYIAAVLYHYYMRAGSASHTMTRMLIEKEAECVRLIEESLLAYDGAEKYVLKQKIETKKHAALCCNPPQFALCRSIFPEIDRQIFSCDKKFGVLYFFILHRQTLFARFLIFTWKVMQGIKNAF